MSLLYSNPPGGRAGIFTIPCEFVDVVTQLNCFDFGGFYVLPTFCAFPPPTLELFLNVVFFFNMI